MDQFIMDCARKQGINLQDYGLPTTLAELTRITKDVKAKDDCRFKKLFEAMKNSHEILLLYSVLQYMNESKYHCEIELLKELFESSE